MVFKYLKVDVKDAVLVATIDRPPANAIDLDLVKEVSDLAGLISSDESVRAAVVASAHKKIFLAGADIKVLSQLGGEKGVELIGAIHKAYDKFEGIPKPTVAAINGYTLGGGLELALVCDFRYASEEGAYLGVPEINLGLFPAGGATQRLPRLVGKAKAFEMMMRGNHLSAAEALQIGLVNKVCKGQSLMEETLEFARQLAAGPTKAFAMIKDLSNRALEFQLPEGLAIERDNFKKLLSSRDAQEGISAFTQKRKPSFRGE